MSGTFFFFFKKKVLIFLIDCGDGDDDGSSGGDDVDMTNLFYVSESPAWRIRSRYAFSFGKLIYFKMI